MLTNPSFLAIPLTLNSRIISRKIKNKHLLNGGDMKILKAGLLAAALATLSVSALAQSYPTKPIRWVVPYTPGGYTDNVTRMVTAKVQTILVQPIIIENKPGAN
jgi:hypothetical protein